MVKIKDEIHIITQDEATRYKQNALLILKMLPEDLKEALITLAFVQKHIEEVTGAKVKGINIKQK